MAAWQVFCRALESYLNAWYCFLQFPLLVMMRKTLSDVLVELHAPPVISHPLTPCAQSSPHRVRNVTQIYRRFSGGVNNCALVLVRSTSYPHVLCRISYTVHTLYNKVLGVVSTSIRTSKRDSWLCPFPADQSWYSMYMAIVDTQPLRGTNRID